MRTSYVAVLFASLLFAAACGDDDGVFEPATPTTLSIVGGANQEGAVGFPVEQQLRVRVLSQDGDPMAGVPVTWTVTNPSTANGGGTLAFSTTITNAEGEAVNSWTLGTAEGPQTVTAAAAGVSPVTFTATASGVEPLILGATGGNNQSGFALERVVDSAEVTLLGSDRLPIVGATVTWTVLTGGGSVSPTTSTTDAAGRARTAWTLGPARGEQTLQARAGDVTATLTATVGDPCLAARPYAILLAGGRALSTDDCLLDAGPRAGSYIEYFNFTPTGTQTTAYTLSSTAIDPFLVLLSGADTVASNDDGFGDGDNSRINIFMGAADRSYRFGATSAIAGQTGAYTFAQTPIASLEVTNCETQGRFFVTPGVTLSQSLQMTDCAAAAVSGSGAIAWHDRYRLFLRAGETITITYAAAAPVDPVIVLFPPGLAAVVVDNFIPGGTETLEDYVAPVTGMYVLDARTYRFNSDELGPYTITISPAS